MRVHTAISGRDGELTRSSGVKKSHSKRSRSRLVDLFWEVLIAIVLVAVILAAAVFYAEHEQAPWMPTPERIKQIGWSLAGFGFGVAYLLLAFSTRRLEQKLSNMPQLQQFITFSQRWFFYLAVSALFFTFGFWSLWPVLQGYKLIPPDLRTWTNPLVGLEMFLGLLWILGGYGILELKLKMSSRDEQSKVWSSDPISFLLAIGTMVYGAGKLVTGLYLLFK
jgi:magnesium-transporting ATPase (P-type)